MDLDDLMAVEILNNIEDAEQQLNEAVDRRVLGKMDPFTLSDNHFIIMFRLSKLLVRQLIEMLLPYLREPSRRSALSVETKVFTTLRFLATGSYQEIVGSNHFAGISQASVSRCIEEVCGAINNPNIFNRWVQFPRNIGELEQLRTRFYLKYNFPGIVGVIDCTHIAIVAPLTVDPLHPEYIYVNRKGYHSLNVQLICDENLKFLNVNATFPGSVHDSRIFRQSPVSAIMERVYRENPENPLFLIGDSGYYLRPWLLTPLTVRNAGEEERFNASFKTARCSIERCNGVLKNRFRCLLKHRVLHYGPEKAGLIVNACVVLHNLCIEHNIREPEPPEDDIDFGIYAAGIDNGEAIENRVDPDLAAGRRLQQNIMRQHFR